MRLIRAACLSIFVAGFAPALRAQATALVDAADPVQRDLQQLVAAGLVDRVILGQQPFSRLQIAQVVMQARRTLALRTQSENSRRPELSEAHIRFLRELLDEMQLRFAIEPVAADSTQKPWIRPYRAAVQALGVDVTQAHSPTRVVPRDNGLGSIDAVLNPLLSNRQGRPLVDGSNVLIASRHVFESSHFALTASPELQQFISENGVASTRLVLEELELRTLIRNLAIDVGREPVRWGQGADVGLLGSANAPPLDLIRFSNEQLVTLPWLLRVLGPARFAFFYAQLGAEQNYPYPYFVGYKFSFAPSDRFEFGTVVYSKSGGHGSPRGTFSARIMDLLPFLDASNYANVVGLRGVFEFSDRYAGIDWRLRFPSLAASEFYGELLLNDFDVRRLRSVLWEDAGHVFGISLPQLSSDGRLAGWLEFHHTGNRVYEHAQFLSGQTSHEMLIGDPLGPDADGEYANVDWYSSARRRLSVQLALEQRSNDQYQYWPVALPKFGWSRIQSRPEEMRTRLLIGLNQLPTPNRFGTLIQLGYERALNYAFLEGATRNNFLGRAALQYQF